LVADLLLLLANRIVNARRPTCALSYETEKRLASPAVDFIRRGVGIMPAQVVLDSTARRIDPDARWIRFTLIVVKLGAEGHPMNSTGTKFPLPHEFLFRLPSQLRSPFLRLQVE
jgi:hypothetical protein